MSIENNSPVVEDNLDTFSSDFFGKENEVSEPATEDNENTVEDTDVDALATTEDTNEDIVEADESDNNEEIDEEPVDEPEPKVKKNRAQERINELTRERREAERRAQELERKLEEVLNKQLRKEPVAPEVNTPKTEQNFSSGPSPSDLNPDGTDKYPLGDFDPNYLLDKVRHDFQEQMKIKEAEDTVAQQKAAQALARQELENSWDVKLSDARERYPDFQEKGSQLVSLFEGMDDSYANYLTDTIMSMEQGTDVLYYLSNNPDIADEIVRSGATKATIALGRIEARFVQEREDSTNKNKQMKSLVVSKAPPPPPINKGVNSAKASVQGDTDDLDAFERELFKRSKR